MPLLRDIIPTPTISDLENLEDIVRLTSAVPREPNRRDFFDVRQAELCASRTPKKMRRGPRKSLKVFLGDFDDVT